MGSFGLGVPELWDLKVEIFFWKSPNDRVPREVVWWALRCWLKVEIFFLKISQWQGSPGGGLVGFEMFGCGWMDSISDKGHVWGCYNDGEGKWERKQGLQCQSGSASGLSPQSIAVYHCIREFREGLPMELLYADDLVLVAETEELLMEKLTFQLNSIKY